MIIIITIIIMIRHLKKRIYKEQAEKDQLMWNDHAALCDWAKMTVTDSEGVSDSVKRVVLRFYKSSKIASHKSPHSIVTYFQSMNLSVVVGDGVSKLNLLKTNI